MNSISQYTDTFFSNISGAMPRVLGAIAILILGIILAKVLRGLVTKALQSIHLDERVSSTKGKQFELTALIAKIFYYFLVIYVCMIVLNFIGVGDVFAPLEEMLASFYTAIPKILTAGVIVFAGYILARLASESVELISESINRFSSRLGFDANQYNLIKILRQVVFLFVFIPILIIGLDKLDMETISTPATAMLHQFLSAVPNIIAAALIIGVFFVIARFITPALQELLKNVGFDELPQKLGLKFLDGRRPSVAVGRIAFFFIMLAGVTTGMERLEMLTLVEWMDQLMVLSGKILFGLVIMVLGNFIANIAYNSLDDSKDSQALASIARVAILGIFFGIGLNAMGIANEIVNLAFGLTLGAVAVAIALSFGLGGREAAGKQMDHILKKFRKDN